MDSECNDAATVASSTTDHQLNLELEVKRLHAKLELVTVKYSRLQQRVENLEGILRVNSCGEEGTPGLAAETMSSYPCVNSVVGGPLSTIESVIAKYPNLHCEKNATRMAVKLAREAVFGIDVLAQCTPLGNASFRALPNDGLRAIKSAICDLLPYGRSNQIEIEKTWKACQNAIGQACKHASMQGP
jgi:hypothetical protein